MQLTLLNMSKDYYPDYMTEPLVIPVDEICDNRVDRVVTTVIWASLCNAVINGLSVWS